MHESYDSNHLIIYGSSPFKTSYLVINFLSLILGVLAVFVICITVKFELNFLTGTVLPWHKFALNLLLSGAFFYPKNDKGMAVEMEVDNTVAISNNTDFDLSPVIISVM